jgi:ketosteroid isomerase-like protein
MKNGLSAKDFAVKFLDPWNAHDKQAVLAEFTDDFEWQFTTGTDPNGTIYRGKAQIGDALDRLFDAVPDIHYEIVDLHEGPGHLIMELLVTGNNRETGASLNFQACDIVMFDGDQLLEKRSYRKLVNQAVRAPNHRVQPTPTGGRG